MVQTVSVRQESKVAMERKKYLTLCEECSKYQKGALGMPLANIPRNLLVRYADKVYYPYAYKLYWEDGEIQHRAELHDLNANCIMSVTLQYVEENNE